MESLCHDISLFYKSQTRQTYIESYIPYDVFLFHAMAIDHPCDSGSNNK